MENNESEVELAEDDSLFAFSPYYDNINEVLNEQYALLQLGEWEYEELDTSETSESSEGIKESVKTERISEVHNQSNFVIEGLSAILDYHVEKKFSHEHLLCRQQSEKLNELRTLDDSNYFCEEWEEEIQEKGGESEVHCAKFSTLEPRYFEIMPPSPAIVSVPAPTVLLHPLEEECQPVNKNIDINIICNSNTAEDFCGASTASNNAQHLREFNELHSCEGKVEKTYISDISRSHKLEHSNEKEIKNAVELTGCDCLDSNRINNIDRSNSINSCNKNENNFEKSRNKLRRKKKDIKEKVENTKNTPINNKKINNYLVTSVDEDLQKRISKYFNDKPFAHVYDPEFRYMFEVPVAAIRHLPPARLNITRLVLCRNYRAPNMLHVSNDTTSSNNSIHYNGLTTLNEGHNSMNNVNNALSATNSLQFGCQMGSSCKFVHADCDYSKLVRHSIHVNYIWRSPELCIYPRLPIGNSVKVCEMEHEDKLHELPSELLLWTNGSLSWTETLCPLHSCVDYDVSGMCTNGELCRFAHRLLIDHSLNTNFKRAPKKAKLIKVEGKSSSTTDDNSCCNSHTSRKEESSIPLEEASENKENRAILEDISVNTVPVELHTSSNVMFKCKKVCKDITSSNINNVIIKEKKHVSTSYVFTIMETDKAKDVLHDMSSIGTILLLPKNSTEALVLGSIQRDDLHRITSNCNK